MTTASKPTTKITGYHLCQLDGEGRVVITDTRRTRRGLRRLESRATADGRGLVVTEFVATDETAGDHGTVYFMDANGEMMDPPHNA
jgi:hypothetical protein